MNEEEKKETYSIPGVIIPEQKTDSGEIIQSGVEKKEENIVSEDKKEENVGVYNIPGVIIPEQQTENGVIQTINNVTEENMYKEPEKEKIELASPIMPGMLPEEKKEEQKEEPKKVKPPKKEGNAKVGLLTLLVIILGGAVLYFAYITYINPKPVSSEDAIRLKQQFLNKKGYIIQELFSWVDLSDCNRLNSYLYTNDVVTSGNLSAEGKLFLAYRQVRNKDLIEKNCTSYSTALHSNDKDNKWYCGKNYLNNPNGSYNDSNDTTEVLDSKVLKKQVEKMFGAGEYTAKSFSISEGSRMLYDKNSDSYILQSTEANKECNNYEVELTDSKVDGNAIILTITINDKARNSKYIRYVTFVLNDDGNFYFAQITG